MLSILLKETLRLTETKCANLTLAHLDQECKSPKAEILTQTQPQSSYGRPSVGGLR